MNQFIKIIVGVLSVVAATSVASAQQSSKAPNSLAPLSSGIPQLDKFAAPAKGSEVTYSHSTIRLVPGEFANGSWTVGVEMILEPGWKTYWRVPGDAGVPSEFIWKKSSNVKSADVSWPAPNRYEDITGKSTGYKNQVVFPVKITPANPGQPAVLDLQLYYAVCSDICIPAQANLGLDLPLDLKDPQSMELIREFAAIVPRPDAKGIKIEKLKAVSIDGKAVLAVTLTGKVDPKTDILVEGFEEAFFDAPEFSRTENGKQIFHLPIDGIDKVTELTGKSLKLTVLSGEIRLEANVEVN